MKLTKQKLHEMIEESIVEAFNDDSYPGRSFEYDFEFVSKRTSRWDGQVNLPDGWDSQENLIKTAFTTGARNKPLPEEYYKNKDVHAAWVEGQLKYDRWATSQGLPGIQE